MKRTFSRQLITFLTLFSLLICFVCLSYSNIFVNKLYLPKIYPQLNKLQNLIGSILPFSLGDCLYLLLLLFLFYKLAIIIKLIFTKKLKFRKKYFLNIINSLLGFFLIFKLFWGFNYERKSIHKIYNFSEDSLTFKEIYDTDSFLAYHLSKFRPQTNDIKFDEMKQKINQNYLTLDSNLFIKNNKPNLKNSLFQNYILSMGISGYYNPFTGEAQICNNLPKKFIPFIAAHEVAHQNGFAREEEANSVAFIHAIKSNDSAFLYSAFLEMFPHVQKLLYKYDTLSPIKFKNNLDSNVKNDFKEFRKFWAEKTNTTINTSTNKMYDIYLKSNGQKLGINSYSFSTFFVIRYLNAYYFKQKNK